MRKFALFLVLAPLSLHGQELSVHEQYKLRVEYREWRPTLVGEIQKGTADSDGTLIDLIDDLEVPEERTFEVRASLQFKPGAKLRGSYTPVDYRGETIANRNLRFGDTTFFRNTTVFSTLKGAFYAGDFEVDFVKGTWGYLGVMIGARYLDADVVLVAPDRGERVTERVQLPIPTLGAAFRAYTGRLSVSGEIAGLSLGSRGHLYEADFAVRLHVSDRLAGVAGYRAFSLKGEDDPDFVQYRMTGLTFGGEISF